MRTRHGLVLAISLLALATAAWLPRGAHASQTCGCDDGSTVQIVDDGDDACEEACSKAADAKASSAAGDHSADDGFGRTVVRRSPNGSVVDPNAPDPRMP